MKDATSDAETIAWNPSSNTPYTISALVDLHFVYDVGVGRTLLLACGLGVVKMV